MDDTQILEALCKYEQRLSNKYIKPKRHALGAKVKQHVFTNRPVEHAYWMCKQIPQMLADGKREKAMRWLGFIQGTLWATGLYSINAMKDDNRSEKKERRSRFSRISPGVGKRKTDV